MKIVKPSAEIIRREDYTDSYKFIEKIGRVCYKSEDKIEEGSAEKFLDNLLKRKHYSVLEHEQLYFIFSREGWDSFSARTSDRLRKYVNHTSVPSFDFSDSGYHVVSMNLRTALEIYTDVLNPNKYLEFCAVLEKAFPQMFKEKYGSQVKAVEAVSLDSIELKGICRLYTREAFVKAVKELWVEQSGQTLGLTECISTHITFTIRFICDRGVSHEIVRHRPCSYSQESTRFCNYGHDGEIEVIEPIFFKKQRIEKPWLYHDWETACKKAEDAYMYLLSEGAIPQEARSVLPNSLKTDIVMTTTFYEWKHFFDLRYFGTTGAPHPQMKELTGLVVDELLAEREKLNE